MAEGMSQNHVWDLQPCSHCLPCEVCVEGGGEVMTALYMVRVEFPPVISMLHQWSLLSGQGPLVPEVGGGWKEGRG